MKILIHLVAMILVVTSCNFNNKIGDHHSLDLPSESKMEKSKVTKKIDNRLDLDDIYPVFRISPNSYGILIELEFNDRNELDKIYNDISEDILNDALEAKYDTQHVSIIDSSSYQKLFSYKIITKELSHFKDKEFYMYCKMESQNPKSRM